MQIIINAGGTGTRLWPLSTKKNPKQFVPLIDEEAFILKTYNRVRADFEAKDIWVTTNEKHRDTVKALLPDDFSADHILTEPERRDTYAAVISYAAIINHFVGEDEPMIFLCSDHYIDIAKDIKNYNSTIKKIEKVIKDSHYGIVLAGTKPYFPSTGYGYIEIEPTQIAKSQKEVVDVVTFKEKPDLETAQQFLADGNYLWNLGYFSFNFKSLSSILDKLDSASLKVINHFSKTGKIDGEHFSMIPKDSFDFAVLEKIDNLGIIDMGLTTWDDIGSWQTVYNYLPLLENNESVFQISASDNKAKTHKTDRKVAFVGVDNLLLIETEEGILVINPEAAKDVKKVAEWFDK